MGFFDIVMISPEKVVCSTAGVISREKTMDLGCSVCKKP